MIAKQSQTVPYTELHKPTSKSQNWPKEAKWWPIIAKRETSNFGDSSENLNCYCLIDHYFPYSFD